MAATAKRTPFNPAGPFVAKKNFSVFETAVEVGDKLDADVFAGRMHERRVELLFNANFIDMAVPDQKRAKHLADYKGDALDRDGDGRKGGSLSNLEKQALKDSGLTVAAWQRLPEPERTTALADAMSRAGPASAPLSPESGGTGGNSGGNGGAGAPETGSTAPQAGSGPADSGAAPEGAKIAGYQHFGFGRWFAVDKDGLKIGAKVSKTEAEALGAHHGVPVRGLLS